VVLVVVDQEILVIHRIKIEQQILVELEEVLTALKVHMELLEVPEDLV
jgi:hypothetical protein